jgi:hypothetical protein
MRAKVLFPRLKTGLSEYGKVNMECRLQRLACGYRKGGSVGRSVVSSVSVSHAVAILN